MSYATAIEQLGAIGPELYHGPGQPRRKFSLSEIGVLLKSLGEPQRGLRAVLIAGTNGKGSTASTLASILTSAGMRTGLYTSPHLTRVNERIRIGETEIADEEFASLYDRVQEAARKLVEEGRLAQLPSFFEVLTAQALLYFAGAKVDAAVLEVGMGGRLDATNIVDPLVSVITDISLDHTEWLGPTIAAITREKAGILRHSGTLIALPQQVEANRVLDEVTAGLHVRRVNTMAYMPPAGTAGSYSVEALGKRIEVESPLAGAHQQRNVALAIAAAVELASTHGFPVTPEAIHEGIRRTHWPGRLEHIAKNGVEWILDVAHNPAGALALRAALKDQRKGTKAGTLVFSCLRDKPADEMAHILFPLFEQVILAPIHSPRATAMAELEEAAKAAGTAARSAGSVREALQWAAKRSQAGAVVVSGSIYLVGEARPILLDDKVII
jgi:dihydrofolate synthase / folylpolyglutamate synthase